MLYQKDLQLKNIIAKDYAYYEVLERYKTALARTESSYELSIWYHSIYGVGFFKDSKAELSWYFNGTAILMSRWNLL